LVSCESGLCMLGRFVCFAVLCCVLLAWCLFAFVVTWMASITWEDQGAETVDMSSERTIGKRWAYGNIANDANFGGLAFL
jgi:hypothetical protein